MPRARSIKPGFFANEDLASLPPLTRLLYIGLWTLADRDGRLENRPLRIKAIVLPYDSINAAKALKDLERLKFIVCYQVDGVDYIAIPAWQKHQSPHVKEPASTIPAPGKTGASTMLAPGEHHAKPVRKPLTPDSGLLTADCGAPPHPPGESEPAPREHDPDLSDLASLIWSNHPKHRRPTLVAAERALAVLAMDTPDPLATAQGIADRHGGWVTSAEWTREGGRYVPHLLKFLDPREGHWMTEPPEAQSDDDEVMAIIRKRSTA